MPLPEPPDISNVPLSLLFTWQQFVNRWGLKNIITVSNKDSTQHTGTSIAPIPQGQPNWYAVQDAFNYATDEVYAAFRGGVVQIPFNWTPNNSTVPPRVSRWAMIIAYCDLYDVRGWEDKNKVGNKLSRLLELVYGDMAMHRSGMKQMWEAVQATDSAMAMLSIKDVWNSSATTRFIDGTFTFSWVQA